MRIGYRLREYGAESDGKESFLYIGWVSKPGNDKTVFNGDFPYPVPLRFSLYSHAIFSMQENGTIRCMKLPIVVGTMLPPPGYTRRAGIPPAKRSKLTQQ